MNVDLDREPFKTPAAWTGGTIAMLVGAGLAFLATPLVFGPVPWADGSAFYLPGLDLIAWPPSWKMHAQAAFVPSYDQANFNLMPALPILLGLAARSGLLAFSEPQLLIRIVSVAGLLAWAFLLWKWLTEILGAPRKPTLISASVIAMAALWDPVIRWGTLVVRTETWIGLCWVWILREIHRWELAQSSGLDRPATWNPIAWKVSAGLAIAAYFHFEAAFVVPATIVGLGFSKGWIRRLFGIAGRTLALLSPWIAYVALHPLLFVEQMEVQFFRLSHGNHWMSNPYMVFHSLFIEHGSPAGSPKFFNVGKAVFWAGIVALAIFSGIAARAALRHSAFERRGERNSPRRALLAGAVAFASFFYLWATKAEVWFITLCHLAFWSWLGAAAAMLSPRDRWRKGLVGLSGAYAALSVLASIGQARATSPGYTWPVYQAWVDCIERSLTITGAGPEQATAARPGLKLWQPHVPDVLVELSRRHPDWDLTRALDFPSRTDLALAAGRRMDAILLTRSFNPAPPLEADYTGPLRDRDRDLLSRGVDTPFGPWALEELVSREGKGASGRWEPRVCETGPFWAVVLVRRP